MFNYYIYKVTDKVTGQFYIGSQCTGKTIGVDYFTSSYNEEFRSKFKSDPSLFDIKIIGVLLDADTCVREENNIIYNNMFILDELGNKKRNPLCLNEHYIRFGKNNFSTIGKHHSEEAKRKMSEAKKGNKSWLGKHHSEEARKKISETKKGRKLSEEVRRRISEGHKNINEETRQKLIESHKGKYHLEETKRKMSEAKYRKVICEEIGKIFNSVKEASLITKASAKHIGSCCQGKRKTVGGYHWRYYGGVI